MRLIQGYVVLLRQCVKSHFFTVRPHIVVVALHVCPFLRVELVRVEGWLVRLDHRLLKSLFLWLCVWVLVRKTCLFWVLLVQVPSPIIHNVWIFFIFWLLFAADVQMNIGELFQQRVQPRCWAINDAFGLLTDLCLFIKLASILLRLSKSAIIRTDFASRQVHQDSCFLSRDLVKLFCKLLDFGD